MAQIFCSEKLHLRHLGTEEEAIHFLNATTGQSTLSSSFTKMSNYQNLCKFKRYIQSCDITTVPDKYGYTDKYVHIRIFVSNKYNFLVDQTNTSVTEQIRILRNSIM